MLVEETVHMNHEAAAKRIPREAIPARAFEFAREHGYEAVLNNPQVYPRRT